MQNNNCPLADGTHNYKNKDWPDLIMFEKWPSRMAFLHEGFSASKSGRKEEDRRNTKRREVILEDVKFQCQFQRKRNEANAKQQLSISGWHP